MISANKYRPAFMKSRGKHAAFFIPMSGAAVLFAFYSYNGIMVLLYDFKREKRVKNILNLTEAAAIALHAMVLLVNEEEPVSAAYIAEMLGVSKHHLSKVLRNLAVAGLVTSSKGPQGGFSLSKIQKKTSFMQVLEAVEGKTVSTNCLFARKPCSDGKCILGSLLCRLNSEFRDYFNNTRIKDFKEK